MRSYVPSPILPFIAVSSCKNEKVDKDCDVSTKRTIKNLLDRHIGNGTFVLPNSMEGFMSVYACDVNTGMGNR